MKDFSVYIGAVFAALTFWVFESLMTGSFQSTATWSEIFIPTAPADIWFRLLTGAVIIGLVISHHERSRKIRRLEEKLYSEQTVMKNQ